MHIDGYYFSNLFLCFIYPIRPSSMLMLTRYSVKPGIYCSARARKPLALELATACFQGCYRCCTAPVMDTSTII